MSDMSFPETPRVDALDKVRGKPIFGADDARPGLLHAALAIATIGKGRIAALDTKAASAVRGVRLVLTHDSMSTVKSAGFIMGGGYGFQSFQPMLSDAIAYRGQPIALVAADTLETAIEAVLSGVHAAVILDGRIPHVLLLELFTEHGAGTLITAG